MEAKVIAAISIAVLASLSFIVYDCCSDIGRITTYMDLPVQALKAYLISEYGLSGSDWDPYSYLGRAPLINYPIIPFLLPALLNHLIGDPILSCTVAEVIYRIFPLAIWAILFAVRKCTLESSVATITYLALYSTYPLYDAHYVRVATTLSYCAFAAAVILWFSNLKRRVRKVVSMATLYVSLTSNFIYPIIPVLLLAVVEGASFLIPAAAAAPIILFTYYAGKLEFDNPPASSRLTFSVYNDDDMTLLMATAVLTVPTILLCPLACRRLRSSALMIVALLSATVGPFLVIAAPTVAYYVLGIAKVTTQLDTYRLALVSSMALVVLAAKTSRVMNRSLVLGGIVGGLACYSMAMLVLTGHSWSVAMIHSATSSVWSTHAKRFAIVSPEDASAIFPWTGNRVGLSISGAFYQGNSEPTLRILSALYFPGVMADFSDYAQRPVLKQMFSVQLSEKLATMLPMSRMEYFSPVFGGSVSGIKDVRPITIRGGRLSVNDALPVPRVRVVYVGSFTDYSYFWINLVRHARPEVFPAVPCLRPYNLAHRQSLDVTRYWTGDVLVVDPEALDHRNLAELIKRARTVIVTYSRQETDRHRVGELVRLVERCGKRPVVLGPVYSPIDHPVLTRVVEASGIPLKHRARGKVKRLSSDMMLVGSTRSPMVIVPWSWAPFWAVNGREGLTCPIGPYMLVWTGGKTVKLHYVAWERHQSKAYRASLLLLAAGLALAAVIPSRGQSG